MRRKERFIKQDIKEIGDFKVGNRGFYFRQITMLSNYMRLELLITMYTESLLDLTPFWAFALAALIKLKIIF